MKIYDGLRQINSYMKQKQQELSDIDRKEQSLRDQLLRTHQSGENRLNDELKALQEIEEEVRAFYRIAKDNTTQELRITSRAGEKPNIARLSDMISRIDPNNYHDPVAAKAVDLAGSYLAYLKGCRDAALYRGKQSSDRTDKDYDNEMRKLKVRREQLHEEIRKTLSTKNGMVAELGVAYRKFDKIYNSSASFGKTRSSRIPIGFLGFTLNMPDNQALLMQDTLQGHLSGHMADYPMYLELYKAQNVSVEYSPAGSVQVKNGIQAILMSVLGHIPISDYQVEVLDMVYYNSQLLGSLAPLSGLKNGKISKIPQTEKQAEQRIQDLCLYYQKLEHKIGTDSVYEYNLKKNEKDHIPLRIIILNYQGRDSTWRNLGLQSLNYLMNNAEHLGLHFIELLQKSDLGGKNKNSSMQSFLENTPCTIHIREDGRGRFRVSGNGKIYPFRFRKPVTVSDSVMKQLADSMTPKVIGTQYFKRYPMAVPERSKGIRKEIKVPFAIDREDRPISCSFKGDNFAAYIMGAAGSGKSTLLHTIISGLLMNYHPDELELCLVDFKMTEFRKYADYRAPHIKYLLLEESEALLFDLIDELTKELKRREQEFTAHKWSKLEEVPPDIYMPAIFIIIDEFAQVSQKLKDSAGGPADYAVRLENLVAKGRAFGFKFIFASQTYSSGVRGLTETARKSINMRLALKSTKDEIKDTLMLNSSENTDALQIQMATIRPYETFFKRIEVVDGTDRSVVSKYMNMYLTEEEMKKMITNINQHLPQGSYKWKNPVFLTDDRPRTFTSMEPEYKKFVEKIDLMPGYEDVDPDDIFIFPGVPNGFKLVKPMVLKQKKRENILLAGMSRDIQISFLMSIVRSWCRCDSQGKNVEIWSSEDSPLYRKYKGFWMNYRCCLGAEAVLERAIVYEEKLKEGRSIHRLIICLDYELLKEDLEDYRQMAESGAAAQKSGWNSMPDSKEDEAEPQNIGELITLLKNKYGVSDLGKANLSNEDRDRIRNFNSKSGSQNRSAAGRVEKKDRKNAESAASRSRELMMGLLEKGSRKGTFFVYTFLQARDCIDARLNFSMFSHKIIGRVSRDESVTILGSKSAAELPEGVSLYVNTYHTIPIRPHIYQNIPNNGWILKDGKIQKVRKS